jgi:RNA polymerase sigma-70 factor (ECF subfamily)
MTDAERNQLAGCLRREERAWKDFVEQYSSLIYHTVKKTLAFQRSDAPQVVDDLFQDIFLSLVKDDFAELRRFRGDHGCSLASWLRMIATRRTIDYLRKSKLSAEPSEELLENYTTETPDRWLEHEQSRLLARAIEDLAPRERILIDLFLQKGLAIKDVATILRTSVGAVYTQRSRIFAKLREALGKSGSL